jgi:hypothetical protein
MAQTDRQIGGGVQLTLEMGWGELWKAPEAVICIGVVRYRCS